MLGEQTNPYRLYDDKIMPRQVANEMSFDDPYRSTAKAEKFAPEMQGPAVVDESGPIGEGVVASGKMTQSEFDDAKGNTVRDGGSGAGAKGAAGAALNLAQGGDADSAATAGLMASGNPYAMAAGVALAAFDGNVKAKNAYNAAVAQAENQKTQNMQETARKNMDAYHRMRNIV